MPRSAGGGGFFEGEFGGRGAADGAVGSGGAVAGNFGAYAAASEGGAWGGIAEGACDVVVGDGGGRLPSWPMRGQCPRKVAFLGAKLEHCHEHCQVRGRGWQSSTKLVGIVGIDGGKGEKTRVPGQERGGCFSGLRYFNVR